MKNNPKLDCHAEQKSIDFTYHLISGNRSGDNCCHNETSANKEAQKKKKEYSCYRETNHVFKLMKYVISIQVYIYLFNTCMYLNDRRT